jgi:hypothetical protein
MTDLYLRYATLLVTSWLFGGMLLFSVGFAPFLFKVLPIADARPLIRKAFPPFYLFVCATSAVASLLCWPIDTLGGLMLGLIAATTLPARQLLMPAINKATDRGEKKRFAVLHTLSVVLTLLHIVLAAVVLVRFVS